MDSLIFLAKLLLALLKQAGRQAGSHPPGDSTTSQAVSVAPWEGLVASQAGRCSPCQGQHYFPDSQHSFQGRKQFSGFSAFPGRQVHTFLGTALLPRQAAQSPRKETV